MTETIETNTVGRVLGTEGSSPFEWHVAIQDGAYLQMGDVVQVETQVQGYGGVCLSGIVTNVLSLHEGAKFEGDVFLAHAGTLPVQLARSAVVRTTRVEPEVWVPPSPGDRVFRASGEGRRSALYFDQMERSLPAGQTRDGEPFYLDYDFLSGVRGGHVNISGVSGVATKTTYASFLLYSMFQSGVLGHEAANTKALIFNVKGEDLLYLDRANARLDVKHRAAYEKLGLPVGPFKSVGFWAPVRRGLSAGAAIVADSTGRQSGVTAYYWTIREVVEEGLLRFMFTEANDAQSQISDLAMRVADELRRVCTPCRGDAACVTVKEAGGNKTIGSFKELCLYIEAGVNSGASTWTGNAAAGTINAFVRRLMSAEFHLGALVRGAGSPPSAHAIDWSQNQVTVVDINKLHDRAKRFVVAALLTKLFDQQEREAGEHAPGFYVVLDELNKYAPREGWSPIKDTLMDIAERGRSLRIILMGCEQTASEVERRIVSNAAIRVVGRLDASEASRPEYGFLDSASRDRAGLLKPGTMLVSQPHVPMPIEVTFPFPAWATRRSEVAVEAESDPFAAAGF